MNNLLSGTLNTNLQGIVDKLTTLIIRNINRQIRARAVHGWRMPMPAKKNEII